MDRIILAHAMLAAVMGEPHTTEPQVFVIHSLPEAPEDYPLLEPPDAILPRKPHLVLLDKGRNPWGERSRKSSLKASNQRASTGAAGRRRVGAYA